MINSCKENCIINTDAIDCITAASNCKVISHRGFSHKAPENTLASVAASIAIGADACEFDVRTTADGRVVLMHDATVDRTTNGTGKISEMLLADAQMRHLRSIEEILDYAIERESEANVFYKNLAPLVKKPSVRQAIENFALDEYRHKLHLEAIRDGEITFTDDEIGSLELADGFDDIKLRAGMTYTELLAYGIKREDKAHRFYTQLAQRSKQKVARELFTQLAQEEAHHRLTLEFEYDLESF
jgi:glycerophosphoryl diester phosphodiesterase